MGWAFAFLLLELSMLASLPQQEQETELPRFRVETFSTLHEVRVVDQQGGPVTGLEQERFNVLEDGQRRTIQYFEEIRNSPASLAILIDVGSNMNREQILVAKGAVHELIHLLDREDEILLAVYEEEVHFLSDLTSDRLVLLEGIENISSGGRQSFWSRLSRVFASTGYTGSAVDESLVKLKQAQHYNKIVLAMSASFGNIGVGTEQHLQLAGARFFAVSWKSWMGDAFNFWGDRSATKHILEATGGLTYSGQYIAERIENLRDTLKSYYLIAYEPGTDTERSEAQEVKFEVLGSDEYFVSSVRRVSRTNAAY
jgi:hypothetical protein